MGVYQALYRAWRPELFKDVYGQENVTHTLMRQIVSGHVAHAYLFCGSRGTGKTTTAKVLARAINCMNTADGEPCGVCDACINFKNESTLDILEIDAASNNGVDEVRLLRDRIAYPPTVGKYKVYIIDEVHMLSTAAFNALLKTLEEPPAHAVFILATTEPQKLPATVLSRCQRYDFRRISVKNISARLKVVLEGIGRSATEEAIEEIAVAAEGGMRDALSLMDMCLSYTDETVPAELVREVLGSSGRKFMFEYVDALERGDAGEALRMVDKAMLDGRDPQVFGREVASHMRTVLLAQMVGEQVADIAQLTGEDAARFISQAQKFENSRLMRAMDLFIKSDGDLKRASLPRSVLEMCTVRASRISREKSVEGLTERVEALEKKLKDGVIAAPAQSNPVQEKTAEPEKPAAPAKSAPAAPAVPAGPDAEKFDKAITEYGAKNAQVRIPLSGLKFNRIDGEVIYAVLDSKYKLYERILNDKSALLEEAIQAEFGRHLKLSISVGKQAASPAAAGGRNLSQTFDIFGRENVELVD